MQPTPQDNQLMSKHRVLSLKPQLRLEWRGQDGQNETEQPDHSASLGDSITASTQIRFSVHTRRRLRLGMSQFGRSILLSAAFLLGSASISVATPFNCSDMVPHSDAYNSGDYGAAFKEVKPISNERCTEAEHLLGVMYAKGQGVPQDLVQAYALLLLADSDGMEPVGHATLVPSVGDDDSELEIVQFGAQLTTEQINQAERLAMKLAGKRGKFATAETAGPSEGSRSAAELRPRVAGYK